MTDTQERELSKMLWRAQVERYFLTEELARLTGETCEEVRARATAYFEARQPVPFEEPAATGMCEVLELNGPDMRVAAKAGGRKEAGHGD